MADRDVLHLALNDQQQARQRIEELRQQIAKEEERIASIEAFVAVYRDFEQRVGGGSGDQPGTGWPNPNQAADPHIGGYGSAGASSSFQSP